MKTEESTSGEQNAPHFHITSPHVNLHPGHGGSIPASPRYKVMDEDDAEESHHMKFSKEDFEEKSMGIAGKIGTGIVAALLILVCKSVFLGASIFGGSVSDRFFQVIEDDMNQIIEVKEHELNPALLNFLNKLENDQLTVRGIKIELENIEEIAAGVTEMFRDIERNFEYSKFSSSDQSKIKEFFHLTIAYHEEQEYYIQNVGVCVDKVLRYEESAYDYCIGIDSDWDQATNKYAENVIRTLNMSSSEAEDFKNGFYEEWGRNGS